MEKALTKVTKKRASWSHGGAADAMPEGADPEVHSGIQRVTEHGVAW